MTVHNKCQCTTHKLLHTIYTNKYTIITHKTTHRPSRPLSLAPLATPRRRRRSTVAWLATPTRTSINVSCRRSSLTHWPAPTTRLDDTSMTPTVTDPTQPPQPLRRLNDWIQLPARRLSSTSQPPHWPKQLQLLPTTTRHNSWPQQLQNYDTSLPWWAGFQRTASQHWLHVHSIELFNVKVKFKVLTVRTISNNVSSPIHFHGNDQLRNYRTQNRSTNK